MSGRGGDDFAFFTAVGWSVIDRRAYRNSYAVPGIRRPRPPAGCRAIVIGAAKKPVVTGFYVVEMRRLELLTPYMRSKCSTN